MKRENAIVVLLCVIAGHLCLIRAMPVGYGWYGAAGGCFLFAAVYGWIFRRRTLR
jgi:hypothetical protein